MAGGREYACVVGDYIRAVYARPLRLKSEAFDAFNAFRAGAESGSGKKIREVTTDNTRELSMREMRDICERDRIKLRATVPYFLTSNGGAKQMIGVLTNVVRAMLPTRACWAEAFSTARTPMKALDKRTPY